jgi:Flp pilus assembly pilin Flp
VKRHFWRNDDGQDLVEYAFLMAFIALVCLVAMQNLGTAINRTYGSVSVSFKAALAP